MKKAPFVTKHNTPITLIPSSSCIAQTFPSKAQLSEQELIAQAYQNQTLNIQTSYYSYFFYQNLTQEYFGFFAPIFSKNQNPHTLDILLPLCFETPMACIFLSQDKNCFCFYQNQKLLFYKEFQDDYSLCLQHIKLLFSYEISTIYCLTHTGEMAQIQHFQSKCSTPITPLLSLFHQQLGFSLSHLSSPITLTNFINLNPLTQNTQTRQASFFWVGFCGALGILLSTILGLYLYKNHLLHSLKALHQKLPPDSSPTSLQAFQTIHSQNQAMLSALYDFSFKEEQKLLILSRVLPFLAPQDIISIQYENSILIQLRNTPDLTLLTSFSSTLGYRCKIFKDGENISLEISKL